MENTYGVGVCNRYDLFLQEEDDPLELLQVREQEKELKKKSKVAEKENKGKVEAKVKPAVPAPRKGIKESANLKTQENKVREEKPKPLAKIVPERQQEQRPVRVPGENREERNNRRNREDRPYNVPGEREDRPPRRDFGERNGERRAAPGVRGGRGGRGGRFPDGRGKREFDRQSGSDKTGIKPVDKREGGGAHNWGTHKDDIVDLNKSGQSESDPSVENDKTDLPPTSENAVADKVNEQEAEPEKTAPVEEEPKELTLDEWKALRAGRQKPNYNLRKAGEGEDLTQWKKMYALDKKKEGEEAETDEELQEYDAADYPQRVGRQKHLLEIEFTFNDVRRGGGGGRGKSRGGRGGPGRGMGAPRGERPSRPPFRNEENAAAAELNESHAMEREHVPSRGRQNAPKVDDEHDFPSLG